MLAVHTSGHVNWSIISKVENYLYDLRLLMTMEQSIDNKIIIIDIDEKSLANEGQWPWPRDKLAQLINRLFDDYQIRSIGFDAVFAEAQANNSLNTLSYLFKKGLFDETQYQNLRLELDHDQRFSEALIARDAVLGIVFKHSIYDQQTNGELPAPLASLEILNEVKNDLYYGTGYAANLAILQQASGFGGFFDYIRDDETLRKVPLIQYYNNQIYPSLAFELARISLNQPAIEFQLSGNQQSTLRSLEFIKLGDYKIPVDQTGSVYVPFRGKQGSFTYISATDVLNQALPIDALSGKIALLGTSASGLLDLRATPVGKSYIGVEVHANIVSAILEQRFKHAPGYRLGIELFSLFILAMLMSFIFPFLQSIGAAVFIISLTSVYCALNLYFWHWQNMIFTLATPLFFIFISGFLHLNYNFFVEQKKKRRLSKVFSQYIPHELVTDFDSNQAEMSLAGENRIMSVLFTDVRNFTNMSEKMTPTELTVLMNEFLTPITHCIHQQQGTIDKYMGDAVMAFWGAPINDEQHASHAISAALNIIIQMDKLTRAFKAKNWPEIKVGIGIASGEMSVGNMGSEFRIAYTVMGDTVNLGSRLEGITKMYGVDIIVSENTKILASEFIYRTVDKVKVKGKDLPVTIFEPLGLFEQLNETTLANLAAYEAALQLYWQSEFAAALEQFETLNSTSPCLLFTIYIERCALYRITPPALPWDGSFTHTSK
ncbi:CHASE2 domain-containing protein [Pseudoalteromonas tunicata]|uniref:CHASE2 domain-containing protein n=1 Tax=Pseudoalteromonas tunicata TaxID=314281 RepID=UPI00273D5CBF|nr:adenylate/guanylate cyclase domain-containing protein [Pseudoalteromonas tunicata]MDP4983972.1 adenylate/guanylate cyclase domain-containing protein [Pseudoalteromonas tunicata]